MKLEYVLAYFLVVAIMVSCGVKEDSSKPETMQETQKTQPEKEHEKGTNTQELPYEEIPFISSYGEKIEPKKSEEIKSKDKYWKFERKYEPKSNEKKTSLYNAPGFEGKGELARKWTTTLEELKAWHIGAYPQSWQFDRSIIDPKTGNILQHNAPPAGETDGKRVYGIDYNRGFLPLDCWELDNYKHLWDGPWALAGEHHISTIKGALLHASRPSQSLIYRLNPETGETLWQLKSSGDSGYAKWCSSDNYFIASINFTEIDSDSKMIKSYVFRIDPITGKNDSIELSRKGVQGMACIGNNLWIQTVDAHLLCVDLTTMKETKDIKINHSSSNLDKSLISWIENLTYQTGNKLLLVIYSNSDRIPSEYILFDTLSGRQTVLIKPAPETPNYIPKVSIINGSLIYQDSPTQLRGVDPDTLETLWWIDKKNLGENAHVAWLDWRGVCVISDTKIMCFGPK